MLPRLALLLLLVFPGACSDGGAAEGPTADAGDGHPAVEDVAPDEHAGLDDGAGPHGGAGEDATDGGSRPSDAATGGAPDDADDASDGDAADTGDDDGATAGDDRGGSGAQTADGSHDDEGPGAGEVVHATLKPYAVGERVEVVTTLDLTLEAVVDMGLFSPTSTYRSKEHETVRMTVLATGPTQRRELDYVEARRVSELPIVGGQEKQHRVHGKAYVVEDAGDGAPLVTRPTGKIPGDTSRDSVLRSWASLSGEPPLHALLAAHEGPLLPGATLHADVADARRLLGLPVEELQIDDLTLVVQSTDDGVLVGEVSAKLSGSAELGSGHVGLEGKLRGALRADLATGRMTDLSLKGKVSIEATGEGLLDSGDGPLRLRRRVRTF